MLVLLAAPAVRAAPFETAAPVALLIDFTSGMTLFEKGGTTPVEPAAMVKMATVAVVADAIKAGETTLETSYVVSEDAWRRGGAPSGSATMFAALRSQVRVSDLLRGIMVQAANDACLVLAEGLAGGEPAFVERMNALAARIGMSGTTFVNATGFAAPRQTTTARDLARLARYLIEVHPQIYAIYAEKEFTWNKIRQLNRNPLVQEMGADGLATGANEAAGYGLTGSIQRNNRRLLMVMHGLKTSKDRAGEAARLVEWGFGSFAEKELFSAGEVVGEARVFGGDQWSVPLVADGPVVVPVRTDGPDSLAARIVYDGPVPAPVKAGERIGALEVSREGTPPMRIALKAKSEIAVGGLARRALAALYEITIGLVVPPARP
jgi:D-alanyl-D-alanine carboxypeptidase (penicillin-binding protein 5/6)